MTKDQLQSVSDWFHASPARLPALKAVNAVCVYGAAAAFFYGVLVRPGFHDPKLTLRLVLTCGVPFVLLSALRVLSAVHFEREVLVGAAIGILSGVIGFGLI